MMQDGSDHPDDGGPQPQSLKGRRNRGKGQNSRNGEGLTQVEGNNGGSNRNDRVQHRANNRGRPRPDPYQARDENRARHDNDRVQATGQNRIRQTNGRFQSHPGDNPLRQTNDRFQHHPEDNPARQTNDPFQPYPSDNSTRQTNDRFQPYPGDNPARYNNDRFRASGENRPRPRSDHYRGLGENRPRYNDYRVTDTRFQAREEFHSEREYQPMGGRNNSYQQFDDQGYNYRTWYPDPAQGNARGNPRPPRNQFNQPPRGSQFRNQDPSDLDPSKQAFQLSGQPPKGSKKTKNFKAVDNSSKSLRETLLEHVMSGTSECMVCLNRVGKQQPIWDCKQCYQIFHLFCIRKWSKQATTETEDWRCPGCQSVSRTSPVYKCFCGKVREPQYQPGEVPHSCGGVCQMEKKAQNPDCNHKCTELCHPGPCPACNASIKRTCPCGKTQVYVKCGSKVDCPEVCQKVLPCEIHNCKSLCHPDECPPCEVPIQQTCYCARSEPRTIICGESSDEERNQLNFSCQKPCQKMLSCGNHECKELCHEGECKTCISDLSVVKTCPCKKKTLESLNAKRGSCLDKIPTCGSKCGKLLECGEAGKRHYCEEDCHLGKCPPCPRTTKVLCRCGSLNKELACSSLTSSPGNTTCEKKCSKKKSCGKHKCGQMCCIDIDHICNIVCGKTLSCGTHRCTNLCHFGKCQVCPNVSFDDLNCYCGAQVLYPPVACGARPPPCSEPCTRVHRCRHEVRHACHSDAQCPPCTTLTEKWCKGKHELRKNVPCHLEGILCGRPCDRPLPCGRHNCNKPCHDGPCLNDENQEKCSQPCTEKRPNCSHPCNVRCHDGPCPSSACNGKVKLSCACGNLTTTTICSESESEFNRIGTALLASKMSDLNHGSQSIVLTDLWSSSSKNGSKKRTLDCNETCAQIERNRRLASALQIENPEVTNKIGPPKFSEFLKDFAKKDPKFAQNVHDRLTELVKLSKESKQKSRSYSFDCMNRDKRQFIHEYCQHFGVTSESFDSEPKRNVVATAFREKSWQLSLSIIEAVNNTRKAPGPVKLDVKNGQGVNTQKWTSLFN